MYSYNAVGWLTTIISKTDIGQGGANTVTFSYSYDGAGNTLTYEDTNYGKVTYAYDDANRLIQVIDPDKACPTGSASPAASGCLRFEYDANGAETKRIFPGNATVTTARDASGRATRITAKDGAGTTQADIGYSYLSGGTDTGNIQTRTSYQEQGIPAGTVARYSYDSLNRLTGAAEAAGGPVTASWSYAYDAAGNRTEQARTGATGAPAATISYSYNTANQLTGTSADDPYSQWNYDGAGNQLDNGITGQTAAYNDRGAVTGIDATAYTGWGQGNSRTLTRTAGTQVTGYLTSPTGLMSGSTWNVGVRAYTRTPTGEVTSVRYSTSRYYFAKDTLGSVVGLFNQDGVWQGGYSYSPYGETRATGTSGPVTQNAIRYISGYYDTTTNLYRLGARYYDPSLGRFTQWDPSGQETNPYAYGAGDPVNFSDPTGLAPNQCVGQAIFGAIALTALAAGTVALPATLGGSSLLVGAGVVLLYAGGVAGEVYTVGFTRWAPSSTIASCEKSLGLGAIPPFCFRRLRCDFRGVPVFQRRPRAEDSNRRLLGRVRDHHRGAAAGSDARHATLRRLGDERPKVIDRSASSNDLGRCEPSRFITGQTAAYNDRGAVTGIDATAYTGWGQGNSRTLTRTAGTQVTGYLTSPTGLMSGSTWNVGVRAYTRTPTGEVTSVRYSTSRYYFAKDTLGSVIGALHTCGGAGATRRAR